MLDRNNNSWTLHNLHCSNYPECLSARMKVRWFSFITIMHLRVSMWQLLWQTYCCIALDIGCLYILYFTRCRHRHGYLYSKNPIVVGIIGSPSYFVLKLTMLTDETFSWFPVKTAWSYLQLFCHITLVWRTTDRQTKSYGNNGTGNAIAAPTKSHRYKLFKKPHLSRRGATFPVNVL